MRWLVVVAGVASASADCSDEVTPAAAETRNRLEQYARLLPRRASLLAEDAGRGKGTLKTTFMTKSSDYGAPAPYDFQQSQRESDEVDMAESARARARMIKFVLSVRKMKRLATEDMLTEAVNMVAESTR